MHSILGVPGMDVERWLAAHQVGGHHRRQISALSRAGPWSKPQRFDINWWSLFAHIVTFWAPSSLLTCCGFRDPHSRQAFREKVALCFIILLMCGVLAVFTFALGPILCPRGAYKERVSIREFEAMDRTQLSWALGKVYNASILASQLGVAIKDVAGRDLSSSLDIRDNSFCARLMRPNITRACSSSGACYNRTLFDAVPYLKNIVYEWKDLNEDPLLLVFDGQVIRIPSEGALFRRDGPNGVLRNATGKDITRALSRLRNSGKRAMRCLEDHLRVGQVSKQTIGCFSFVLIQILALTAIGLVVIARFILAVAFSWFISRQLDKMKRQKDESATHSRSASVLSKLPGPNRRFSDAVIRTLQLSLGVESISAFAQESHQTIQDLSEDPFVILLVTCYSESETSLKLTLDSLALTDYHDRRKLIFIIADGEIKGEGNERTTPEIAKGLLKLDSGMDIAIPQSYLAVSEGSKRHNMAKVHAGLYYCRGRDVPCILVAKCGTAEEGTSAKPGNRGKRDSQLILMNFMQRVIFNDRMTPLDFDIFNKICWLMGVPPDVLEIVLMVDADTKVAPDSLSRMVNAMRRDKSVMGLCGETRIANKRSSWVTAIQVFEYYISHHLGKAFESVFGGVTCLPGCFCMYRLKVPKNGQTLPILASPSVIEEYSQANVDTLHKKNLLLLGEDRFLTTLMLKNFPKRKMIFVPQAYCKTFVPDEFRVLLSQRRRWINSTIHNLMELVLVPDLCGIFCFSMQFVILMELIGTVVLPAAIIFTYVLIGVAIVNPLQSLIPLILLGIILGLPALLILITTRKIVYLWWMIAYLIALPIWNFVLPLYAYWHFDDFSWGQTRKIEGPDTTHGSHSDGTCEPSSTIKAVPMKTWAAWSRQYDSGYQKSIAFGTPVEGEEKCEERGHGETGDSEEGRQ